MIADRDMQIRVGVAIGGKREVDMNDWAEFEIDPALLTGTGSVSYTHLHSRNIYGIIASKILLEPTITRMKLLPDMYALFGCHQNMHRAQGMMLHLIMLRRKIW